MSTDQTTAEVDGMPTKPGYYWAKWRIPADGTHEAAHLCPSDEWEIVQVNENTNGVGDEALSVSVPGVRETQWRDCFVWGGMVSPLHASRHRPLKMPADRSALIAKAIRDDDGGSVAARNPNHMPETP